MKIYLHPEDQVNEPELTTTEDIILQVYKPDKNTEVTLELTKDGELVWILYRAENNKITEKELKCRPSYDGSSIECEVIKE